MNSTLTERLYAKVVACPDPGCDCDGCLLWTGTKTRDGYGRISVSGQMRVVHQVAWKLETGAPVPDGLFLDHVKARGCRHRNCVKVTHLEPVTNRENLLRGDTIAAAHIAQTHCKRGHLFNDVNTEHRPGGGRSCRLCVRIARRARRLALAK